MVTRGGFSQVVGNGMAGQGFSAEAPCVYEFPIEMFLPGSDLTPITENIDKVVYGLTKWEPKVKEKGIHAAEKITVTGKDYQEAVANMNELFLKNMWADGLPLLPATEESVNWILTGTDLSPDTLVGEGKILPRGGVATVESLAVSLAMAGGRPEYLPVLIAAIEAMTEPDFQHQGMSATTMSTIPTVIVNGPIAKQIRLNSGYGLLGPSSQYPAGGPIGRAIRIMLQDMGGATPGIGTMAIYGGMRYTNAVFAEDEDGLPPDWPPISVERGFAPGSNTVSFLNTGGVANVNVIAKAQDPAEQSVSNILEVTAGYMRIPSKNALNGAYAPGSSGGGLVFIPTGVAWEMSKVGWSKEKVRTWLWENARIPDSPQLRWELENRVRLGEMPAEAVEYPYPLTASPEEIWIVVAGGEQSGHNYYMMNGTSGTIPQTKEIELPANWDALLAQAEEDLGPIPAD